MSPRSPKMNSRGFTLTDLVIVLGIVFILTAILVPMFASARAKSRALSCQSNLKQLSLGFLQYLQDNNQAYPTPHLNSESENRTGSRWAGVIAPYVHDRAAFECPNDTLARRNIVSSGRLISLYPVSYAYNANIGSLAFDGIGGASGKMTAPSKTVMLCEVSAVRLPRNMIVSTALADLSSPSEQADPVEANGCRDTSPGTKGGLDGAGGDLTTAIPGNYCNVPLATGFLGGPSANSRRNNYLTIPDNYSSPHGRHSGGSNFLMADGHVKWLRGDQVSTGLVFTALYPHFTQPTDRQDQFTHLNHQPLAAGTQSPEHWAATFSPI